MSEHADFWVVVAEQANLAHALEAFPDDVAAAAASALAAKAGLPAVVDNRAEPWPPMRVGAGL